MSVCLVCDKPCTVEVYPNFLACRECGIAIRNKETIAINRQETYGENWVEMHWESSDVNAKAEYLLSAIRGFLQSGRVLDVGCASGVLINKLAKAGYSADGVDWSEDAITFASKYALGHFVVAEASLSNIKGEELYDMIVASHIVEHLEKPQDLLAGVKRLLKPNGYFCITTPNLQWYESQSAWRNISSIFDYDHVACYTHSGLVKLLSKAGFRAVKVLTRTHKVDLLTAMSITVYNSIFKKKKQLLLSETNNSTHFGVTQRIYKVVTSIPLFPVILYIPNRISERKYRGMELIVVVKPEGGRGE